MLMRAIQQLIDSPTFSLDRGVIMIVAINSVTTILNQPDVLDDIIAASGAVAAIANALCTVNMLLKLRIWQLLSAICLHSDQGRNSVVKALETYRTAHCTRYRFSVVISESRYVPGVPAFYYSAVVGFVNSLLYDSEEATRLARRAELCALGLLEELHVLRQHVSDPHTLELLDTFYDEHRQDDAVLHTQANPLAEFTKLVNKLLQTPHATALDMVVRALCRFEETPRTADVWRFEFHPHFALKRIFIMLVSSILLDSVGALSHGKVPAHGRRHPGRSLHQPATHRPRCGLALARRHGQHVGS